MLNCDGADSGGVNDISEANYYKSRAGAAAATNGDGGNGYNEWGLVLILIVMLTIIYDINIVDA